MGLKKHLVIGHFTFSLLFIGHHHSANLVFLNFFYVSKLRYHEVSLVTINQQTSYDFGILRQDDRIIKCLPMNQVRFADCVTI